jgi:hypothetical protein
LLGLVADVPLKAPFPYPGGKSRVADLIWDRFGNVDNFIEPFCGTLAVTLRRPAEHFADGYRVETVNDANHYIVNFWRAVKYAPDAVAEWADWPVMESDLHARHKWLVRSQEVASWREKMRTDPEAFDAKIAGWWVWGQCCWIGGAWCNDVRTDYVQMPQITNARDIGAGVNRDTDDGADSERRPSFSFNNLGPGVRRDHTLDECDHHKRPVIANDSSKHGHGIHGRPQLTDAFDIGRGVNASAADMLKRPGYNNGIGYGVNANVGATVCDSRRSWLTSWMRRLSDRLRLVRTCYGHWARICDSDSTLTRLGTTGVFLDPPYPANRADTGEKSRDDTLYATDKGADLDKLRDEVLDWCRRWGQDKRIRVAICGYEGDGYEALEAEGWTIHAWEAGGGYANQRRSGKGKSENAKRERIWFSPACIKDNRPKPAELFA